MSLVKQTSSPPPEKGSGDYLVPIQGSPNAYTFRSHEALCACLGIREPYNTCQAYAPHARINPPHCARTINRNKRGTVVRLLADLAKATVPSPAAAALLQKLSPHVVCGQTGLHQYQAPMVVDRWRIRLWHDVLCANGLRPQAGDNSSCDAPALSPAAWDDALYRARSQQRVITFNLEDIASSSDASSEDDSSDNSDYEGDVPISVRDSTPNSTPNSTPSSTPNSTPDATPKAESKLEKSTTPGKPNSTVQRQPQQVQQTLPHLESRQPQQQTRSTFNVYRDPEPTRPVRPSVVSASSSLAHAGGGRRPLGILDRNKPVGVDVVQVMLDLLDGPTAPGPAGQVGTGKEKKPLGTAVSDATYKAGDKEARVKSESGFKSEYKAKFYSESEDDEQRDGADNEKKKSTKGKDDSARDEGVDARKTQDSADDVILISLDTVPGLVIEYVS